jgi:sugar phosphate isomerase/epimerase
VLEVRSRIVRHHNPEELQQMRLGTCLPYDESSRTNGVFDLDKALDNLAKIGVRGCLTNFPNTESEWEEASRRLARSLEKAGIALLEYNTPFCIDATSPELCRTIAERTVKALSIAESIGCLNVAACVSGPNGILPHPSNRSERQWETLKQTCELIVAGADKLGLRARLLIEPVYTTIIWSPQVLAKFIDEIGSPNVQGHMDLANCLNFDNIYDHEQFTRDAFAVLGDRIHSAHIKDAAPQDSYFPGLVERYVGDGVMDFRTYLRCLSKMPSDFSVVIEHIQSLSDIERSYRRVKSVADEIGISIWTE